MPRLHLRARRAHALTAAAATLLATALAVVTPTAAYAWGPGAEPTQPYAQPALPDVPVRGCQSTVANPSAPTGASPALQVIYAWHDGNGNNYEANVEYIAKVVDRVDWALDQSSNYDQHVKLSCRTGYDTSTYAGYARSLVVPEKIDAGANPNTSAATVRSDLISAGYDDSNRIYLVFTDFASNSDAYLCPTGGGYGSSGGHCSAVTESWTTGVAGHELAHVLGAPHAWMTETGAPYYPEIMYNWVDHWNLDPGFRNYYDPSELSASFYIDPHPSTATGNIANHPMLTAPTCCDVGANNDSLTAEQRTFEAATPGSSTSTLTSSSGWHQVTPSCGTSGISCTYFDGRRSAQYNTYTGPFSSSSISLTNRPAVTAGNTYKLFTRLRANAAVTTQLQLAWYNSGGTLLSTSSGTASTLASNWLEYRLTATAPANATSVRVTLAVPNQSTTGNYAINIDSFQLNNCTANTGGNCRYDT
ncbi:hypothetical protein [Micromonospora okii]|uniref:hypothetical protein n=1 Tax=Micromonospora okii TaxID=1182970 RepID=UPI001E2C4F17|nr:hypothetical protein [Micromonospora okii]